MRIAWHRGDLRLHDHPAASASSGVGIVIFDPQILDNTSPRRCAWFARNVQALRDKYHELGGKLIVRTGAPWKVLPFVASALGAGEIHALRSYTPYGRKRDGLVTGVTWHSGCYVREPGTVRKADGTGYAVFTPFFRRWSESAQPLVMEAPSRFRQVKLSIDEGDIPEYDSDVDLPAAGEDAALAALHTFIDGRLELYELERNRLDGAAGSRLSCYFTLGVLSSRYAFDLAQKRDTLAAKKWISELAWRDFMADVLLQHPHIISSAFDQKWDALPWSEDNGLFDAWKNGETGFPVVDAAMRELRSTGFISNRARMVAAQFLSKVLMVHWQRGEQVFKDWLIDGDTAQNVGGWQWCSGLGIDAAPYFRVFNPVSQGATHDPSGEWLTRWVPECSGSPRPLESAVVDLATARERYLQVASRIGKSDAV